MRYCAADSDLKRKLNLFDLKLGHDFATDFADFTNFKETQKAFRQNPSHVRVDSGNFDEFLDIRAHFS